MMDYNMIHYIKCERGESYGPEGTRSDLFLCWVWNVFSDDSTSFWMGIWRGNWTHFPWLFYGERMLGIQKGIC